MALVPPNLDDRTFAQLVQEARQRIMATCPEWNDLSIADPGMVLVEVFAYLTETMIYRLNRVPDKVYVEFLRLLGVSLLPPEAASVSLVFKRSRPSDKPLEIPRGTRVSVSRAESGKEPPVFVLARPVSIAPGSTEAETLAYHCDLVDAELVGKGTGLPGLSVNVGRPPIVASTTDELDDLIVGVEATAEELGGRAPAREFGGKAYRVWREVPNFTELGADTFAYRADRATGLITFAPAVRIRNATGALEEIPRALAAVPAAGREIRAWYQCGGGPLGNVSASTLTVLKDPIPGVSVSNAGAAVGGRSAETIDNALLRGPHEVHSFQRAVTARDFELVAKRTGAVSRAHAFTKATLWKYAIPGTVEVVLVPFLEEEKCGGQITVTQLQELETDVARERIQETLDQCRPLGTICVVSWARYKTVKVRARIVAQAEEDTDTLKARVLDRLYKAINPMPSKTHGGWRFGQALRSSTVYDAALSEPGVSYVEDPQLIVEEVPEKDIGCLAVDPFQPQTWYSGSHEAVYRSLNDGEGWAIVGQFSGKSVYSVQANPEVPGLIALATKESGETGGSCIYISWDCGENWQEKASSSFAVEDMAWASRDGVPLLFLATMVGLFELSTKAGSSPVQIFVRPDDQQIGYYAVAVANLKGGPCVAVATRKMGGIFLSSEAGRGSTFRPIGMAGEDVRVLAVQYDGAQSFLWAGQAAPVVGDPGKGCFAWELLGSQDPPEGWQTFNKGWLGGSCVELAFQGNKILAATFDGGVLWLDRRNEQESWHVPDLNCGLPQSSREHPFERVDALAADPLREVLMTGGKSGAYRSKNGGQQYEFCSRKVFTDKVTLPPNWLFCSGEHELEVVTESERRSD